MLHRGVQPEKRLRDQRWAPLQLEVRRWLLKNDLSQGDLARRLGASTSTVQRWFGLDDIVSPPNDRMDELEQLIKEQPDGNA